MPFYPSISANDDATNRAGVDALITMNVHFISRPEDEIAEVFGALNTAFNRCMKCFYVAMQMSGVGEVFCTD